LFLTFYHAIRNAPYKSKKETKAERDEAEKAYPKEIDLLYSTALFIKANANKV
jgi:hypothetical protein